MKLACNRRPQVRNSRLFNRRGFTLMELVVVLVVLIAVAGVVLPMLPAFLTKTHDAVTTTNIAEVDKAMMAFLSTNLAYPDQFDSIMTGTSMYTGAVFNSANPFNPVGTAQLTFTASGANTAGSVGTNAFYTQALSAGQASSLTVGGIMNLIPMNPAPTDATFNAYLGLPASTTGKPTSVATGTTAIFADNDYIYQKLNLQPKLDSTNTPCNYVVFGLGPYCTIVGSRSFGIFDAPVAFGEHFFEQPSHSYARMLCVFRVYQDSSRCEFVGAAHPDPTGLGTSDMHTQEYYQTTN
jgi:prepilin-type N-terminal cleavage/methylation domain-containing protein